MNFKETPTVLLQILYLIAIGLGIALILVKYFSVNRVISIIGTFFGAGVIFLAWYNSRKK